MTLIANHWIKALTESRTPEPSIFNGEGWYSSNLYNELIVLKYQCMIPIPLLQLILCDRHSTKHYAT